MSDAIAGLRRETEAARQLLENMRDILADDEELTEATLEGETNLMEAIERGASRLVEIEVLCDGIKALTTRLKTRCERLENQYALLKTSLQMAIETAGKKKVELPVGTLSLRATQRSVQILDEAAIPSRFWKPQDPKLDKKAIGDALKAGEAVDGAVLSNGGTTLQFR